MLTDTESDLLARRRPFLEYLPVVDLSSGRLLGMEALVRWQHPTEGLISPGQLIPQAESQRRHRVADPLGPDGGLRARPCTGRRASSWASTARSSSCGGARCPRRWRTRSRGPASASGQLTLEVTEDAIVDPSASADLKDLSEMGVQLSVDDVGTNWSSFEPFQRHCDQHREDRRLLHRPASSPPRGSTGWWWRRSSTWPTRSACPRWSSKSRTSPRWRSCGRSMPTRPRGSSSRCPCRAMTPSSWPAATRRAPVLAHRDERLCSVPSRRGPSGVRPESGAGADRHPTVVDPRTMHLETPRARSPGRRRGRLPPRDRCSKAQDPVRGGTARGRATGGVDARVERTRVPPRRPRPAPGWVASAEGRTSRSA